MTHTRRLPVFGVFAIAAALSITSTGHVRARPLMIPAFNDCSLLIQPTSMAGFDGATDEVAGSNGHVAGEGAARALLGAGGAFACGPDLACNPATQYCYVSIGGPTGVPPGYRCVDVPDVAPPLTCETVPNIGIGCECTESDDGITVTCTAP
jgi:hypothetical protein